MFTLSLLLTLKNGLYVGYGTSLKSEKESFERALAVAREISQRVDSLKIRKEPDGGLLRKERKGLTPHMESQRCGITYFG